MAGFFTDTQELIDLSVRMLRILAPGYIVAVITTIFYKRGRWRENKVTSGVKTNLV